MLNPGDPWPMYEDLRDWKVWRCMEDSSLCDEAEQGTLMAFPATQTGVASCPGCGKHALRDIGYTVAELHDIEETLSCGMDLALPRPPPLDLVPLTRIPKRMWVGLPVFVAGSQNAEGANWWNYDTGVIMETWLEGGDARVRFLHSLGGSPAGTLNYAAMFCWVPKPLADRLTMSDVEKLAEVGHD